MEQEQVIEKVLIDLQKRQVICNGCYGIVAEYIGQAFVAGFEHNRFMAGGPKSVLKYDRSGELAGKYPSAKSAAIDNGVLPATISRAALGYIPSAAGYYWRYE